MLQDEVADRLVAPPGTRDYGVLTLSTALGADVTRVLEPAARRLSSGARRSGRRWCG